MGIDATGESAYPPATAQVQVPGGNPHTGDTVHDSAFDTSVPDGDACLGPGRPADAAASNPTCSTLDNVEWTVVVEQVWQNTLTTPERAILGSPIVLPRPRSAMPWIHAQTGIDAPPYPAIALTGSPLDLAWISPGFGLDADRLGGASLADAIGVASDTWIAGGWADESLGLGTACLTVDGGVAGALPMFTHADPLVLDVDHDAIPEVFSDRVLGDSACSVLHEHEDPEFSTSSAAVPLATGELLVGSGAGVLRVASGDVVPWRWLGPSPEGVQWTIGMLPHPADPRFLVSTGEGLAAFDTTASVAWSLGEDEADLINSALASADLDGDGTPEVLAIVGRQTQLTAFDAGGATLWTAQDTDAAGGTWTSGLSLADLDADGVYEVITWGSAGLFIRDGATGAVLASDTSIATRAFWTYPVAADVDADGSAEIVVAGEPAAGLWDNGTNAHLYVVGPAEGRWARTRPVWNQTSYDATTVRDDGVLVRFPRPSWQDYRAWRAQPAHDGDRPDLAPRVGDGCATACEAGGTVELEVIVENLGSMDAPAGTEVVLSTWTEGDVGLVEVARATIAVEIPSMTAAEGIVFSVPWEQWNDARVVDVYGATYGEDGHQECDYVNDRLDVWVDPCGE